MAASFNITLPGAGDQIAAAVTESLKHYGADNKAPSASSIGEEVGKHVAAALDDALAKIAKPAFDATSLREQILANADAILNLYIGSARIYIEGFMLTVTGTGEQTEAALVAKGHPDTLKSHLCGSIVIIQGPYKDSDIDALLALHEATKLALTRARSLSESRKGGLIVNT